MTELRPEADRQPAPAVAPRRSRAALVFALGVTVLTASVATVAFLLWRQFPAVPTVALVVAVQGILAVGALTGAFVIVRAGIQRLRTARTVRAVTEERDALKARTESLARDLHDRSQQLRALDTEAQMLREQARPAAVAEPDALVAASVEALAAQHAEQVAALTAEIERLTQVAHGADGERAAEAALAADVEEQVAVLTAEREAQVAVLTAEREEHAAQIAAINDEHVAYVADLVAEHQMHVSTLAQAAETAEAASVLGEDRETLLLASYDERLAALTAEHAEEIRALNAAHEEQMTLFREAARVLDDEHTRLLDLAETLRAQEVTALSAEHAALVALVRAECAQQVADLITENDGALAEQVATHDAQMAVTHHALTEARDSLDTLRTTSEAAIEQFRREAEAARTEERFRSRVVIEAVLRPGAEPESAESAYVRTLRALDRLGPTPALTVSSPPAQPARASEPEVAAEPEPRRKGLRRR